MRKHKIQSRRGHLSLFSFWNYLIFFLLSCFVCGTSILLYGRAVHEYGDDFYNWRVLVMVFANLIFVNLIVTVIDSLRRKFMIELPVKRIITALDEIQNGNFDFQIEAPYTKRVNEFDDIIDGINQMVRELRNTEVMKTDFLANVTHEIKTPLAIIQNYAVLLQDQNLTKDEQEEYVRILLEASKRVSGLTVNILKLNKLEKQEIGIEQKEFDVGEQLRTTFLGLEGKWSEKDLEVDVDIQDVLMKSDPNLLEIIWNNLLSNAIKFTPVGGTITIILRQEGKHILVMIKDTGCGMDEMTGKHIFEKFYQGDTSHKREGNGLGLAMVKRVVDLLNGEIMVESQVGKGSTFIVTIPINHKERRR